jgi:hypothetical protein
MNDTCQDGIRCQCGTGVFKMYMSRELSAAVEISRKPEERVVVDARSCRRVREIVRAILEQGLASSSVDQKRIAAMSNGRITPRRSLSTMLPWIQTMTQMKTE